MNLVLIKKLIISPLLLSSLISLITTPLVIFLYRRAGWIEDPKKTRREKDTHTHPVPRGGGIPIFLSLVTTSLILLQTDHHLKGIILGATVLCLIGVLDDIKDLNPYLRLLICLIAAFFVVGAGIGIAFVTNPFGGIINLDQPRIYFNFLGEKRSIWILADLLAIFWIVFLTNIVNWAKGFDGQLPGIVIIATLTIAIFSFRYSADITQWPVAILASIVAGAYLGFLPFNFYPQRIMPGYGGGALAGFMIAVLTILSTSKILTGMVVLGIPLVDAFYSIFRRIAAGRSPVWGDRGHLHHKLLDEWKWGKRRTAIFYWLITAFLGILALNLNSRQKFYTIVMLVILIGGLLLWFNFSKTYSNQQDQDKH